MKICILNQTTGLIDAIDQSQLIAAGTSVSAIAEAALSQGDLVTLHNVGGVIKAKIAVGTTGTGTPAHGYVASNFVLGVSATVFLTGVFSPSDSSSFTAADVGVPVYLSPTTPGAVTKTRPLSNNISQQVGYVVGYAAGVASILFISLSGELYQDTLGARRLTVGNGQTFGGNVETLNIYQFYTAAQAIASFPNAVECHCIFADTVDATGGSMRAGYFLNDNVGAKSIDFMQGVEGDAIIQGVNGSALFQTGASGIAGMTVESPTTGTVGTSYGLYGAVGIDDYGTITNGIGVYGFGAFGTHSNITTFDTFFADTPVLDPAATVGSVTGLHIGNYADRGSRTDWAIKVDGGDSNFDGTTLGLDDVNNCRYLQLKSFSNSYVRMQNVGGAIGIYADITSQFSNGFNLDSINNADMFLSAGGLNIRFNANIIWGNVSDPTNVLGASMLAIGNDFLNPATLAVTGAGLYDATVKVYNHLQDKWIYIKADATSGRIGTSGETIQFDVGYVDAVNTVTFSATPVFNLKLGNVQKITLTANVTSSTITNQVAGESVVFIIKQDATGGRTFVWPTNVKGAMTISAGINTTSAQRFVSDGTNLYATAAGSTGM